MKKGKIIGWSILGLVLILGLSFGIPYWQGLKTKTGGKFQQDAQREVFESTQSYVEGKRQEAAKSYKEWVLADADSKQALESLALHTFANFDHQKFMEEGPVKTWVHNCKNGISNSSSTIKVPEAEPDNPF